MTKLQYNNWLSYFQGGVETLCGNMPEEGEGSFYFAYAFTKGTLVRDVDRCEECLNHEDLPLLVLSFLDEGGGDFG